MDERKKTGAVGALAALAAAVAVIAVIGLTVVYTGSYNVAATEEHASFTRWVFDTTFHNSVRRNAADLTPPESFTEAEISTGAHEYKSMCEHCHGGPGVEADEWASGMRPRPPHLTEEAAEWEVEEVFWLVKHGARMTGMPAFGPSHDDHTLWSIAGFVRQLPAMTPERYAALGHSGGEHPHGDQTH